MEAPFPRHLEFNLKLVGGPYGPPTSSFYAYGRDYHEVLRERLVSRATDPIEAINQRVDKAAYELTFRDRFDVSVVNDDLNTAVQQTRMLIHDFVNQ